MTKFTEEQLKVLEEKILFTSTGFNIVGDLPGHVGGDVGISVGGSVLGTVWGNVGCNVGGNVGGDVKGSVGYSVLGKIGHGWVRKEPDNNPEIPDSSTVRRQPMTKFTPEQLALLEEKIEFTEEGFNIVGDLPGSVGGDVGGDVSRNVCGNVKGSVLGNVGEDVLGSVGRDVEGSVGGNVLGNVGRNVWGSVLGRIGYGWVREEIDND